MTTNEVFDEICAMKEEYDKQLNVSEITESELRIRCGEDVSEVLTALLALGKIEIGQTINSRWIRIKQ